MNIAALQMDLSWLKLIMRLRKRFRSYFKKVDFRRETPKINLEQMGLVFKGDYI
ncbi:MAG: hypothetical protein PWR10_1052 [Halanaerobiales bacterium]|nr:hypothetical protein [Halanaerobiales bacterium]